MNIKRELKKIAKELSNPIRQFPDYGVGDSIQHQLAEKAGIDLEKEWKNKNATRRSSDKV